VAANLAGLGCPVSLIGVCGRDEARRELTSLLEEKRIEHHLLVEPERPTITKTRIMGQDQQLLRIDEEDLRLFDKEQLGQILALFDRHVARCRAVIISDYGKGFHQTPELTQSLIRRCRKLNIPVLIDPKGKDWERYAGATCVTPNTHELEHVAGEPVDGDESATIAIARKTRLRYRIDWCLVTRGPKGMCLVGADEAPILIATKAREVYDVSGAGDTVIATLGAAIAAGLPMAEAATLANFAAGVVVGKLGTQPVTHQELTAALNRSAAAEALESSKLTNLEAARLQVSAWRAAGERIVFTNGCFDLLHPGHIHLLHRSRRLGDRLIVGLNSDGSVQRLKGAGRPILAEQDRAAMLSALACVDMVILFEEDTPLTLISAIGPDVLVKGSDYEVHQVVGRDIVESRGGRVALVPLIEGYSTTRIVNGQLPDR
jgi:D-beta-D-heptose 7-phosphate kinase/D-beta-D-heptose 1-phosphate adenosyltransferase